INARSIGLRAAGSGGPLAAGLPASSLDSMPIVTVEIVGNAECAPTENLAQSIADVIGRVLDCPPGETWVRLRSISRNDYAENEMPVEAGHLPVFVTVLKRQQPGSGAKLQTEVDALTQAIAQAVRRPAGCIHLEYAPSGAGRVSFGGKLVE